MNMYPGVKLRVTEAWDEDNMHSPNSLHYEGRAVDITTSDRDRSKYDSADLGRSGGCFSGNSTVHTLMGKKKMSQLSIGDKVLVTTADGSLDYSEVILFLDRDNLESRWFQTIITESGAEITLTSTHLIFTKSGDNLDDKKAVATYAKNVEIGHFIYVVSEASNLLQAKISLEKVINVTTTRNAGIFAPLTLHGTVVVNNVVASCYAVISNHQLAHVAFLPMRILYNFKQAGLYFLQQLHMLKFKASKISTSQGLDGIHWYAELLYKIIDKLASKNLLDSWHIDFLKI
ncbi:Sonic hedgehog protein A [Araneus ventricosus]|uniref:Sonic hedgehog protein A n=1 Tax=Araneus ventricosus TaxID=182803 RepID=A0A4Y2D5Z9_ARAVE|nr:Sonic hedgehog protein A [Araneus ventricosus]